MRNVSEYMLVLALCLVRSCAQKNATPGSIYMTWWSHAVGGFSCHSAFLEHCRLD